MKKASYTDRKMTEKERVTAEENYYLVGYYMRKSQLDFREWSGILSISYIQAIKKYTDYERLHCYSIKTIIFKSLDSTRANYMRSMNCAKRKPQGGCTSLDRSVEENRSIPIAKGRIISSENEAISNLMIEMILERMKNEEQREILIMLVEGYKKVEIQRHLNISYYYLQKNIRVMRNMMEELYFGGNDF